MSETYADDGAVHRFWRYVVSRRRHGDPLELDDVADLRAAVDDFDREQDA